MKKTLVLLCVLLFAITVFVGCTSNGSGVELPPYDITGQEPVVDVNIYGAIHRIVYGDNVVYLFGSLHGGRDTWYPLADVVEQAMNRADVFVSEFGLADTAEQNEVMQAFMILPAGQTWAEFLPQDAYDHMVAMAETWELNYDEVNTMHPAFLIFSLEMQLALALAEDMQLGNTVGDISVDGYVMTRAVERDVPVLGLESIEQQARILYAPPFEVILARVMYHFMPPAEMMSAIQNSPEPSLDELADMYAANDLTALAESFAVTLSLAAQEAAHEELWIAYMREYVMNWRSAYYAIEIARLLQETQEATTFFVVVGISHIIRGRAGAEFTDIVEQLELLGIEAVPMW